MQRGSTSSALFNVGPHSFAIDVCQDLAPIGRSRANVELAAQNAGVAIHILISHGSDFLAAAYINVAKVGGLAVQADSNSNLPASGKIRFFEGNGVGQLPGVAAGGNSPRLSKATSQHSTAVLTVGTYPL
jgi:hypothetical protein